MIIKERLKKIYKDRRLLYGMSLKQFKEKHAGSKLGIWWAIATPLVLALSINFVFINVFNIKFKDYTLFVLAGLIPWAFFINSLTEATYSFTACSSLLKQTSFPREFVSISSILSNLFNFMLSIIFLIPLFIISNSGVIKLLPVLVVVIIIHSIFIIGLGFIVSSLNIFSRDLNHFLPIAFMIWFWVTPVFYSLDMVAKPFQWVCIYNPMTYFIAMYQSILFKAALPTLATFSISVFLSVLSFFSGYLFFVANEADLLKRA
ncbi:MAG: ABC transporter permease [Candidatus Omnitrophota bacterium]